MSAHDAALAEWIGRSETISDTVTATPLAAPAATLDLPADDAAPFATRQPADLGARVIKIERPGTGDFARGDDARVRGLASHFVWTNRCKESLTLDVKHPDAARVLERLGCKKGIVGLVLPTGYSFNLDGIAIYLALSSMFMPRPARSSCPGCRSARCWA